MKNLNQPIEDELEKQFPKGDSARGKALVLYSIAQIEYNKLQEAFDIALEENNRLREEIRELKLKLNKRK